MTKHFAVFLSFNGNCAQAFTYYQQCFGGELSIQTLGEELPCCENLKNAVVCATLRNKYFKLLGTDLTEDGRVTAGNNISILVECDSVSERAVLVGRLTGRYFCSYNSENRFIQLMDRYSVNWILGVGIS